MWNVYEWDIGEYLAPEVLKPNVTQLFGDRALYLLHKIVFLRVAHRPFLPNVTKYLESMVLVTEIIKIFGCKLQKFRNFPIQNFQCIYGQT